MSDPAIIRVIVPADPAVVRVIVPGPPGAEGEEGPPGPEGPPGTPGLLPTTDFLVSGGTVNRDLFDRLGSAGAQLDVREIGAVANGATDSGTLAANTAAINAAIAASPVVYIPPDCNYTRGQLTGYDIAGHLIVDDSRGRRVTNFDYEWEPWPLDFFVNAHRGFATYGPDSTLTNYSNAAALAADGVTFDIQLSLDNVPMVIHDPTMAGVTGGADTRRVDSLTVAQIQTVEAGISFNERLVGTYVSTLSEMLAWCKSRFKFVGIEVKTDSVVQVLAVIEAQGMERACAIISDTIAELEQARALNPYVGVLLLASDMTNLQRVARLGNATLSMADDTWIANPTWPQLVRKEGVTAGTYTLTTAESDKVRDLLALGVSTFSCNRMFSRNC